jgi:hypothetical protein
MAGRDRVSSSLVLAASISSALSLSACRKPVVEETPPSAPSVTPDRLQKAEVMPGRDVVFGLVVPRRMRVGARFVDAVMLTGDARAEEVANHFRGLIHSEKPEVGAARTVFPDARILAAPDQGTLRIEVAAIGDSTRVWIRKVKLPPPPPPGRTPAEIMDAAGYNADGSLKDPLKRY